MADEPKKVLTPEQEQRRKAVLQRAQAAAAADGKQWPKLSQDERQTYRERAREELRSARNPAKAQPKSP